MKIPRQIFRIILLAVGIVSAYSVARFFLTPPTFREYGWYRGAALTELREREPVFAGKKACEECHADHSQKLQKGAHKSLSCEACHGAAQAHVENPDVKAGETKADKPKLEKPGFGQCVRCHEANPSRPKWHKQIVSKDHYTGSKCTECHVPHSPTDVP